MPLTIDIFDNYLCNETWSRFVVFGSAVEMKADASLVVSIPISYSVETKDFAFRSHMYFEEKT